MAVMFRKTKFIYCEKNFEILYVINKKRKVQLCYFRTFTI